MPDARMTDCSSHARFREIINFHLRSAPGEISGPPSASPMGVGGLRRGRLSHIKTSFVLRRVCPYLRAR